VSTVNRPWTG